LIASSVLFFEPLLHVPAHQTILAAIQVRLGQSFEEFLKEDDKIAEAMEMVADLLKAAATAAAAAAAATTAVPAPSPTCSEQIVPVQDKTEDVAQPGFSTIKVPDVDEDCTHIHLKELSCDPTSHILLI
jgi:hypothetical protein